MGTSTTMNVSLPGKLKKFVKQRVDEKQYSNPSDYVRSLIREDQVRREEERLEQMLVEGLHSGIGPRMKEAHWDKILRRVESATKTHSRKI